MDSIALKIKERNEKIWKYEAHIKCVSKNIDTLNSEIKRMEEEMEEMREDTQRNETYIKQIRATTELIKSTLETTNDSIGYMLDLKSLLQERNDSINARYTESLAACRAAFAEHKTRLESTSSLYQEVKRLTIEKKARTIHVMDLKQKVEDQLKMNAQARKMKKEIWQMSIVKFAKSCLDYYKARDMFHKLKAAEAEEKQLVKKVLELQRKVKEKKAINLRTSRNEPIMPVIDFNTCLYNSETRDSREITQKSLQEHQIQGSSKSGTGNSRAIISSELPDVVSVNQPFKPITKKIELNPLTNKVRVLSCVVQPPAKAEDLVKFGNHYVSKKILQAGQKRKSIQRKSSVSSSRSYSQGSTKNIDYRQQASFSQDENLNEPHDISQEILTPIDHNFENTEHTANEDTLTFSQNNAERTSIREQMMCQSNAERSTQHGEESSETFPQHELPMQQSEEDNDGTNIAENEKSSHEQNTGCPGGYKTPQQLSQDSQISKNVINGSYKKQLSQPQETCVGSRLQITSHGMLNQEAQKVTETDKSQKSDGHKANIAHTEFHQSKNEFVAPKPVVNVPLKRPSLFGPSAAKEDSTQVGSSPFFNLKNNFTSFFNMNKNKQSENQQSEKAHASFGASIAGQDNTQFLFGGGECEFTTGMDLGTTGDLNLSFLGDLPQSPPMNMSAQDEPNPPFGQNTLETGNGPESNQFSFGTSTSFFNLFSSN